MKYKYIIWDWNATLFDDVEISVYTMNKMIEKTNAPILDKLSQISDFLAL